MTPILSLRVSGSFQIGRHRVGDRVAVGAEHAAFERRAILARSPHQPYAVKMDRERELKIIRQAYAKQVTAAAGVGDPQVEAAFAAVAREDFLGPGPWHIVRWGGGYRATPDADPIYLYTDDVIGILPERNLNNGQPSLHAALIAAAGPQPGEHAVHIGAGVGYYTAILAALVGAAGRVTAIEFDIELAARATANLAPMPHVRVVHGDGTRAMFEPADVIYVNAGATRPADVWLDRLKEGGRLILPLTADGFPNRDVRRGAVFRIERRALEFLARRISGVAIFPCEGGRDEPGERAVAAAFERGGAGRVTRLYRRDDLPEDQCWLRAPGWCLAYC
jgi:protein-L-isoaspartate(D-aspartate) O-methyltransferase